jgi:anti-sigma28 factor (negative regulator of flagellin synthesis)
MEQIQAEVSSGKYQPDASEVSHSIVNFYLIPLK